MAILIDIFRQLYYIFHGKQSLHSGQGIQLAPLGAD